MDYLLTFFEGILTFISPCLLPMLPIYLSFLAGGDADKQKVVKNSFFFVLGFTIIFVLLGATAATLGRYLFIHMRTVNMVGGIFMILLGINYTGLVNLPILNRTKKLDAKIKIDSYFTATLFGAVFSIGWTPCIGTFLSSALMKAANSKTVFEGSALLLVYCLGLGVPFVLSAVFMDKLKSTFHFIKKHYKIINICAGVLLIILGLFMATGNYYKLLNVLI